MRRQQTGLRAHAAPVRARYQWLKVRLSAGLLSEAQRAAYEQTMKQTLAELGELDTVVQVHDEESLQTSTIITTQANEFLTSLHHRMPVILDAERADRWLAGDDDIVPNATDESPKLRAWPVDRRVNNARNEGDDLIEPDGEVMEG